MQLTLAMRILVAMFDVCLHIATGDYCLCMKCVGQTFVSILVLKGAEANWISLPPASLVFPGSTVLTTTFIIHSLYLTVISREYLCRFTTDDL